MAKEESPGGASLRGSARCSPFQRLASSGRVDEPSVISEERTVGDMDATAKVVWLATGGLLRLESGISEEGRAGSPAPTNRTCDAVGDGGLRRSSSLLVSSGVAIFSTYYVLLDRSQVAVQPVQTFLDELWTRHEMPAVVDDLALC